MSNTTIKKELGESAMQSTEINGRKYMEDRRGALVPLQNIDEINILRDGLVRHLVSKGQKLQQDLQKYKKDTLSEIQAFIALSAAEYDVSVGGKKGNITLLSFDGRYKVQVQIGEFMTFDERLQVAKKLIDGCLLRWTDGGNANIKALVGDTFQVDKEGKIDTKRILELRRLKVEDEDWQQAMRIISESLQVVGSREYVRIYRRDAADKKWEVISLDIAAL